MVNAMKAVLESSKYINQKWANEMHIASVHPGISGQFREALWMGLLRGLVPLKYALAQGVILIDSQGNKSDEVDLAIYDEQYIPYVFRHKSLCYIPIEAVAAVFQCKSNHLSNKKKLKDWACSIKRLQTSRCGIARTQEGCSSGFYSEVQTGTRPLRVLAVTKRYPSCHKADRDFRDLKDCFDIFLYQVSEEAPYIKVYIPNEEKLLAQWGVSLNCTALDPDSEKSRRVIRIAKEALHRYEKSDYAATEKGKQDIESILRPNITEEDHEKYYLNLDLSGLKLEKDPNSWLTLNLQLNQLLMLRNNPMFFPHYAYARKFREEAGVLKMNPKPQTDKRKKNINAYPIILQNYTFLNEKLAAETKAAFCHDFDAVKDLWRSFLRSIIPMKFSIDKNVVIIDSAGGQSEELDLVVYDEQYIPYVFQFHSIKYVPIEAVSVVVKLHDQEMEGSQAPERWERLRKSLKALLTSPVGIARFATSYATGLSNPTQRATRPIRLLISTADLEADQSLDQKASEIFDFLLYLKPGVNGVEQFELKVPYEQDHLEKWAEKLNSAKAAIENEKLKEELKDIPLTLFGLRIDDNPLLTLNFQLNQLLMLINNPMLFPHYAYAKQFRQAEQREESGVTAYVFVDVSRKQEYIFRHNQLRNNLFHSMVIKLLTEDAQDFPHDQYSGITLRKFLEANFKDHYQFVYSGGGNSIIKWNSEKTAKDFIAQYTTTVLKEYPELELYISLVLDSDIQSEAGMSRDMLIRRTLIECSDLLKDKRRARFKRWSYGIERIGETGLPVMNRSADLKDQIQLAKDYLKNKMEQAASASLLQYTDELQDYKQIDEGNSYIGVIAVDGNRMGEMVSRITSFEDLHVFSRTIEELYTEAMIKGLNKTAEQLGLKRPLLFTPVVMAGDDVCLIVPATAAIQAAANIVQSINELSQESRYQNELARIMKADAGDSLLQLQACAGVAIARYSYPFFELVRRAEAKCRDAKETIHLLSEGKEDSANASFLDWEIVQGQTESAKEPDCNRYGERLRIRPLRLDGDLPVDQRGIFGYRAFLDLAIRLQQSIYSEEAHERISRSFLTELKRAFHAGWDVYKYLFEMKRTGDAKKLSDLVQDVYPSSEFAAIECRPGEPESRTYLLHDVLQVLRFIQPVREDQADAVAH